MIYMRRYVYIITMIVCGSLLGVIVYTYYNDILDSLQKDPNLPSNSISDATKRGTLTRIIHITRSRYATELGQIDLVECWIENPSRRYTNQSRRYDANSEYVCLTVSSSSAAAIANLKCISEPDGLELMRFQDSDGLVHFFSPIGQSAK